MSKLWAWLLLVLCFTATDLRAQSLNFTYYGARGFPYDITTGSDGAMWFTKCDGKIGRITTAGIVTEYSVGDPKKCLARIVATRDGSMWVNTQKNGSLTNWIGRITTQGVLTEYTVPGDFQVASMTAGSDGALWFTSFTDDKRIGRLNTSGDITIYQVPNQFVFISTITAGPDGALWFFEFGPSSSAIGRMTLSGDFTSYPLTNVDLVYSSTVGPDRALWFGYQFGPTPSTGLLRITTTGQISYFPVPQFVSNGLTTGPDGALWYTTRGALVRMTTSGSFTAYNTSGFPTYVLTGPDGALWFTDNDNMAIGRAGEVSLSGLSTVLVTAGGPAFTLTVNGAGFQTGSAVQWNGSPLSTTFVSGTQLTATVPAGMIASPGTANVLVRNPGGAISNVQLFTVRSAGAAVLTSLSPNSSNAGGQGFTLTVNGSGFVSGATVNWNSSALATSFVSANQLTAAVPGNLIGSPGSADVTVRNPGGAATSNALSFTIGGAATLSLLSPNSAMAGGPAVTMAVNGSGFVNASVVQWNGSPLPTGFVSATQLTALVPASLIAASGTASVIVANPGSLLSNALTFTINGRLTISGVVNAACYAGGSVAPGEIVTIFGSGLGPRDLVALQLDVRGYVSSSVAGTQVLFDGIAAPVLYTQAGQVSVVVPYAVSGKDTTQIQARYQGQSSIGVTLPVSPVRPCIFTADSSGRGQGAIVNQDSSVNAPSNPAPVGSVVSVYGTGEGQTNPPGVDGKPVDSLILPLAQVSATVGGLDAQVLYAGGGPGLVAGVLQVNVKIPEGVGSGNAVPIVIRVGDQNTQVGVTLAVR